MTGRRASAAETSRREIRVFVSSTFRDMQAERDELVLRTFPQLRKLCERRGVTWGEIDLRWGITEEQKAEGKALPICLAEIERCRYFIALIGERYGWVPEEIEPELIEQQPWLEEHLERSVTELEVVHGVLRRPAMADHAFFYLRDPRYLDSLPERERLAFVERATERRVKLDALKDRIRGSGFPVEPNYPHPKALGALVLRDLTAVIDGLYPEGSEPEPLEREAAEHEAFARSRAAVYIGRTEHFGRLDAHAAGAGPPLVVLGESGVGKSALLSNWALRHRDAHPDDLVLMHFAGSSPYSTDWRAMLRRILAELAGRFKIDDEIPDDPAELRRTFANRLHMAAARGRVVLVIDGLNQLEDRDGALELTWLPPRLPANVRLVLSTLSGRPLEEVERREWPTLEVEPLDTGERAELITEYLRQYAHALGTDHLERIVTAPQSANPLYLRAVLEELRVWGEHKTLGHRIDHYLAAEAIDDLYDLILARYEEDYDDERLGLVRDAMSLIWASRRGLSEAELLDLLGSGGEPLPAARWSPLHLAAEQSIAKRSGLLGFSHDYLRRAVRDRYLADAKERQAAHLRIAGYFGSLRQSPRAIDELPWQLAEAASWERLSQLLADPAFAAAAWDQDKFDVRLHWVRVEANSPLRLVDAYRPVLDHPDRIDHEHLAKIADLLKETEHDAEALALFERVLVHYRRSGERARLQGALGRQAGILTGLGRFDESMALLREQEQICRELADRRALQGCLGRQAGIHWGRGELAEMTPLLGEQEQICRELPDPAGLATALGMRAGVHMKKGEIDAALTLYREEERLFREAGHPAGIFRSLRSQAQALTAQGQLDEASVLLAEQERLVRELGSRTALAESLIAQADVLVERARAAQHDRAQAKGFLDEALALHDSAEQILREQDNPTLLAASLRRHAEVLVALGALDQALALYREQAQVERRLERRVDLAMSLGSQAELLRRQNDLDGATAALREQAEAFRGLRPPGPEEQAAVRTALANSLGELATVLRERGELDDGIAVLRERAGVCRELDDPAAVVASLVDLGASLTQAGRASEGLPLVEEAQELVLAHGPADLAGRVESILRELRATVPRPGSLAELLAATSLRYEEDPDGAVAVRFRGDRVDQVGVTARELDNGVVFFAVSLPALGQARERALGNLMRVSFEADYVKPLVSPPGEPVLVAELHRATLSPAVCAGVMRGLAALADVAESDLADSSGWEGRLAECAELQAAEIQIDVARAQAEIKRAAVAAGLAFEELPSGNFVVPLRLGAFKGGVLACASAQATSLTAYLDVQPMGDKERYMSGLLQLHMRTHVAKIGLSPQGKVALLYEVPLLAPDSFEHARTQFESLASNLRSRQ